jgi:hypothetical protein
VAVAYVAAVALRSDPTRGGLGALLGLVWLVGGWRVLAAPVVGVDAVDEGARGAARVVVLGAGIALVAAMAPPSATLATFERIGVAVAATGSLVVLGRIRSLGGIAASPAPERFEAAILVGLLWAAALALPLIAVIFPDRAPSPEAVDLAALAAALATAAITIVGTFRLYARRRYELGLAERAAGALWLTALAAAVGILAGLMAVGSPERLVPLATLVGAVSVTASVVAQEPTRVARLFRTATALVLLCAPIASLAVFLVYKAPGQAGLLVFVVAVLAALVGVWAPRLAHRLGPERGAWLDVLVNAIEAAKEPDPRRAVAAVLEVVREELGPDACGELYRIASADRVVVDRAGYLHAERATLPADLVELAEGEPYRVLSTEALRSVQVRRPEVRELVRWLDQREAGLVALVHDEEVCVGALTWPAAGRTAPLSLEEVKLARRLADHLGLVTGAAASLERSRRREIEAERALHAVEGRIGMLEGELHKRGRLQRRLAEMLARPLEIASYSPATAMARHEAEEATREGGPLALVAPPGSDVLAWAALAHLASPRRDGPLVWIEGAHGPEQSIERWTDLEAGPLVSAEGGTLVILDGHALSPEAQRLVAHAAPKEVTVVLVLPAAPDRMVEAGTLEAALEEWIAGRVVTLPRLAERAEDLRALAFFELSRLGTRRQGAPLGLSLHAQEMLLEHDWPGNEAELRAILLRAADRLGGRRVIEEHDLRLAMGDPPRSGPRTAAKR